MTYLHHSTCTSDRPVPRTRRAVARRTRWLLAGLLPLLAVLLAPAAVMAEPWPDDPVTLVADGEARMRIVAGDQEQAHRLQSVVERISGATLEIVEPPDGDDAADDDAGNGFVYVGRPADFADPWFDQFDDLGHEGYVVRTDGSNLYLIGSEPLGVQWAVTTLMHEFGHRWFFPGEAWEVVPEKSTIEGAWNIRTTPDYRTDRRLWYGYGGSGAQKRDLQTWRDHNHMGGPVPISIGHTWYGINNEADIETHPEWFAEVDGERRGSKPCYSEPAVVQQMIDYARSRAADGAKAITLSPPDGLNYCECQQCRDAAGIEEGTFHTEKRALFGTRADGTKVCITSETLFAAVNKVAEALEDDYPDVIVGCYAYSAYSHPPSFEMHPNVYVQPSTSYRRTPMSQEEQLTAWGKKANHIGIREYWSVYQWDYDWPEPGDMRPGPLQETLKKFNQQFNVTAINAESSNNWAIRGLGYYLGSKLLWDVETDLDPVMRDFYEKAFGPAAKPVQRYWARWYGPGVVVIEDAASSEIAEQEWARNADDIEAYRETLRATFRDLTEAAQLVEGHEHQQRRVDHLRMYAYYLWLRLKVAEAADMEEGDARNEALIEAIGNETTFGGRQASTNMIHTDPLITESAFYRRFRPYRDLLETVPEERIDEWRQYREPPTHEQMQALWQRAARDLDIAE